MHIHSGVKSAASAGMRVYSVPDPRMDERELAEFRCLSYRVLGTLRDLKDDAAFWAALRV